MYSFIQFISTPTADTRGTALLLHFDQGRYIIGNIHEGISRAVIERKTRVGNVTAILVTGTTEWKNLGGLMGMILTLADNSTMAKMAKPQGLRKDFTAPKGTEASTALTIHGGRNVRHTLATARRFIFRKGMPVMVNEYTGGKGREGLPQDWKPDFADHCIKVWAMAVEPSCPEMTTTSATSQSPRKRSFDDFITEASSNKNSIDADHAARKEVLYEMFDSKWRHDILTERLLADVEMPTAMFVRDKETNSIQRYQGPTPDGILPVPHLKVLVRKPWPAALLGDLPPTKPSHGAMSYIIQSRRQRGRFLPEIAKELSVPKPLWSRLADGFDVQSTDGKTIKPEMVLGESKDNGGVVVADLPSQDYVRGFLDRPEWQAAEVMIGVEVFIWILGPGVGPNEELQTFIHDRKHLKHIISSPDLCPNRLSFGSSASESIRLNRVDPPRYHIPVHDNVTLPQDGRPNVENGWAREFTHAETGLKVQLRPALNIKKDEIPPSVNPAEVLQEITPEVLRLAETARAEISSESVQSELAGQDLPSPDAEIIFLGTGSSLPSKRRNLSGTLLRVPGSGSYLLDCGENTLGQLKRMYSAAELGAVLRDLKLIWISHLHADHHLGIASVIKAWYEEVYGHEIATGQFSSNSQEPESMDPAQILRDQKRLFIVSHALMLGWLKEYSSVEDFGFDRIVPVNSFPESFRVTESRLEWNATPILLNVPGDGLGQAFKFATGLTDLVTCSVSHCFGSQAVSLTFPTGFKFSYSGDCRPSKRFAKIGRGSTVLLHEATFEDERKGDAAAKKHCTISQAIAVGKEMGARRVLLTHFSQRYSRIPNMSELEGKAELEVDQISDDLVEELDEVQIPRQDMTDLALAEAAPQDEGIAYHTTLTAPVCESPTKPACLNHSLTNSPILNYPPVRDFKVGVGFDYMRVKVADIMLLEKFTPALVKLCEDSEDDKFEQETPEKPRQVKGKESKQKKRQAKKSPTRNKSPVSNESLFKNESPARHKSPAKSPKPSLLQEPNPS